jgi:hypothetical protein
MNGICLVFYACCVGISELINVKIKFTTCIIQYHIKKGNVRREDMAPLILNFHTKKR